MTARESSKFGYKRVCDTNWLHCKHGLRWEARGLYVWACCIFHVILGTLQMNGSVIRLVLVGVLTLVQLFLSLHRLLTVGLVTGFDGRYIQF